MENKYIIRLIKDTAKFMELYGENDFKLRSYNSAVFNLEKLDVNLAELSIEELERIDGVGKSIAKIINEINETQNLAYYQELLANTPKGVQEMMKLSGFGPKKIKLIWEELKIETLEDIILACDSNKIAALKGFGDKTQEKLKMAALFKINSRHFLHFREAEKLGNMLVEDLKSLVGVENVSLTAELRRKMEVIKPIEILVATNDASQLRDYLRNSEMLDFYEKMSGPRNLRASHLTTMGEISIHICKPEQFFNELFRTTASPQHLAHPLDGAGNLMQLLKQQNFDSEEAIYEAVKLPFIAPELREGLWEFEWAKEGKMPDLIETGQLKGILHNHSTYSDGIHTLEAMAKYCKELGYEYLGISDHSKTAAYANGLQEFRVKEQQIEIDKLNAELGEFKVFKGIESDILGDGSLDYSEDVLASFDFIVASIHSQLNMDEKTATNRLIKAISNPFTTILGHPTGRLLLQRQAYPVNHEAIIDACAEFGVVIEINAHPYRLDLDWRYVHYAIEKGVKISINPDAHEKAGYHDMYYGVCVGRKAGLTAKDTFNALGKAELEKYFEKRKQVALSKA
ncbi:DNA polymerase/3'-5' exonuclease PolX [Marivirga sp. S37H4]|uniref:DNA polymerase/3'-5' exonuclease PolX n=1 Tax=Marivirga aurantiaca TaxID=2802615 RepID=A0A934WYB0_9BACT|nr:DNA polymerase/3'-5' exonuclease PolX [Marivirga aurantiaca]MBK6265394.1 DNA polymerase/3'-5' exonuclease PolX [Marivirga aurantiaca]